MLNADEKVLWFSSTRDAKGALGSGRVPPAPSAGFLAADLCLRTSAPRSRNQDSWPPRGLPLVPRQFQKEPDAVEAFFVPAHRASPEGQPPGGM